MMRTRAFGAMLATVGLLTATAPTLALAAPHPSQITVARGDAVASRTTEVTLPQAEGEAPPVELVDWSDGCFAATDQKAGVWLTYRNNTSGARNIVVAATMFDARPSAEEIATVPIQAGGTRTIVYEADNGLAYRL